VLRGKTRDGSRLEFAQLTDVDIAFGQASAQPRGLFQEAQDLGCSRVRLVPFGAQPGQAVLRTRP
jgi:hypothetical protein